MSHPNQALRIFLRETGNLIQASNYLLTVHLSVLRGTAGEETRKIHDELGTRLSPTYSDPHHFFMSVLFIAYVAAFELFLQETAKGVMLKNPKKAGSVQFKLSDVLDADSQNDLVTRAIDEVLTNIMYKRPLEYRKELATLLSINEAVFVTEWSKFVEAKARRDLAVHAGWKCNATYLRKLKEVGLTSTLAINESAIPQWESYILGLTATLGQMAESIAKAVVAKHWPGDVA